MAGFMAQDKRDGGQHPPSSRGRRNLRPSRPAARTAEPPGSKPGSRRSAVRPPGKSPGNGAVHPSSRGGAPPRKPSSGRFQRRSPAAQREQAISRTHSQRRHQYKRNYTLYYIMLALLLTVTGVILSLTVFFNIETITVTGSELYTQDQVLAVLDVQPGDNLLRLNTGKLGEEVRSQLVETETVTLKRHFPNSLEVAVEDAQPAFQILWNGQSYQVSTGGRLIRIESQPVVNVLAVVGLDPSTLTPGAQLSQLEEDETEAGHLTSMQIVLNAMEQSGIADISAMDFSDPINVRVYYQNRLEIRLGSFTELPDKLDMLRQVLESGGIGLEESGTADVSSPDRCITNNQAEITLPEGLAQPGWTWTDPHSDNADQLFGGDAAGDAESGEEGTDSSEPASEPASGSGEGETSSQPAAEPQSSEDTGESSESGQATTGGFQLPQLPGLSSSPATPESSESDTTEPAEEPSSETSSESLDPPSSTDSGGENTPESSAESSDGSPGYALPQLPGVTG